MPTIRNRQSIAAAATVANILAGSEFEFLPVPAQIQVAITSDQVDTELDVSFGNAIQIQNGAVPQVVVATTGFEGPRIPEDIVVSDIADAGDRLVVRVRNPDAVNPAVVNTLVMIKPLA